MRRGSKRGGIGHRPAPSNAARWTGPGRHRSLAVLLLFLVVVLPTLTGTAAAGAAAGNRRQAADPSYPYVAYLRSSISTITPTVVTATGPELVTVTGTVTNVSRNTLYDLRYAWRRGSPLPDAAAARAEISTPSRPSTVVTQQSAILTSGAPATAPIEPDLTDLAPGASLAFTATVPIGSGGLELQQPGVFAVLMVITADIGQNGRIDYERVGELHLLTTVLGVPGTPPTTGSAGRQPVPVAMLWPFVDVPHVGVGGIFLDDSLARSVAPGGRLFGVLAALRRFGGPADSTTVVVDPELLAELQAMSAGYRVLIGRRAQPPLTPNTGTPTAATPSTGHPLATGPTTGPATVPATGSGAGIGAGLDTTAAARITDGVGDPGSSTAARPAGTSAPVDTVAGTGAAAAVEFLASLREAIAGRPVLVLPYSDPDSVAMVRAGLQEQLAGLIDTGRTVAAAVLQRPADSADLLTDIALPEKGVIDGGTMAFLAAHGMSRAVLSPTTLSADGTPAGAVRIDETGSGGPSVDAAVTDAVVLPQIQALLGGDSTAASTSGSAEVAALLTAGARSGQGTPVVVAPDLRWTVDTAAAQSLGRLLSALAAGGVVVAGSLPAIASAASRPATVSYPAAAEQAELSADYLAGLAAQSGRIAGLKSSLSRAPGVATPAPADLLDPLTTALTTAGSAGLRRGDRLGRRVLATVAATVDNIRNEVSIVRGPSYTLASSTSPLLITVRNDTPYAVRVRVVLIGGASVGLTATDPGVEEIPAGRSQQFHIDAKVVKAGKFPVQAQLQAADGSDWSDPVTLTVSSSAYGALTIILVLVAGAALTLMVGVRVVQRLRGRGDGGSRPPRDAAPAGPAPDSILGAAEAAGADHPSGPPDTAGHHDSAGPDDTAGHGDTAEPASGSAAMRPTGSPRPHRPGNQPGADASLARARPHLRGRFQPDRQGGPR